MVRSLKVLLCSQEKKVKLRRGGINGQPTTLPDFLRVTPRHPREKDIS